MKILQIITQGERGGAQVHIRDMAILMRGDGHVVHVATGEQETAYDGWLFAELTKAKFDPHNLHITKGLQRSVHLLKDVRACWSMYKLIRRIKPDVVHLHSSKAGTVGAVAARLAGAKVVYTAHGFVFNEPMSKLKKAFYIVSEFTARFFRNYTITVSKYDQYIGRKMHVISRRKAEVIYNGIDEAMEKRILTKKEARRILFEKIGIGFGDEVKVVGLIANLYESKGVTHLIHAAYLAKRYKDLKNTIFIVMGEGHLRKELEKEIEELEVGTIFFLVGAVPDAYRYLKAFDLFAMPSVKEGFPYALLESMLAHTPFVATKVGGIPEIEQYAASSLVVPGSAKFLTEAIVKFLNTPKHKKIEKEPFPEKFTLRHMVDRVERVYDRVVG